MSACKETAKGSGLIKTWLDISRMGKGQTQADNRVHSHCI